MRLLYRIELAPGVYQLGPLHLCARLRELLLCASTSRVASRSSFVWRASEWIVVSEHGAGGRLGSVLQTHSAE